MDQFKIMTFVDLISIQLLFIWPAGFFDESNSNQDPLPEEDQQQDDDDLHNCQDNH